MAILVFIETSKEGKIKKTALEAVSYSYAMGEEVTAIVLGTINKNDLKSVGRQGAKKILCVSCDKLNQRIVHVYASVLSEVMEKEKINTLVLANSLLGTPVAARIAVRIQASFASNVVSLPDTSSDFVVKQSIFSGKAFLFTKLENEKKIIAINKNTIALNNIEKDAEVINLDVSLRDEDFTVRITSTEETTDKISLPEAEIIVSGGRGMQSADSWNILEDLAKVLGAALGCSKPVSDMGWRPHHEHVGQTGIKVAPQLYIAVGISGAIQHLAGVNSSKCIVVINQDEEAPFFKIADYGIVGDALKIVPQLTTALQNSQ